MIFSYSLKVQTFVIKPMIKLLFSFGKTFDEVTRKLQNYFSILEECFFNNFLVLISDKCYFMTLGTPNTLPNFKCKNITLKNSVSEKPLGVIIDNKLDFTEPLNTVCKKANLKLYTLNRISRFCLQSSM